MWREGGGEGVRCVLGRREGEREGGREGGRERGRENNGRKESEGGTCVCVCV